MTTAANFMIQLGNVLETKYTTAVAVSPVAESQVDNVNPFLTPGLVLVSRFPRAAGALTVNYATANGTALSGTHYAATSGTLTIPADPVLTARRYAVLSQAFRDLCGKISREAAAILTPHLDRIGLALKAEYDRRFEIAEPVLSNKRNHPTVKVVL